MKFRSLTFQAFGPYVEKQHIDFTKLDQAGLFLIAGPTGAGKSTVLDAIVYALYGKVPRYDVKEIHFLRSRFAAENRLTEVTLEFEHEENRYRVTRTPKQEILKEKGGGTKEKRPTCKLDQWIPEIAKWQTTATKVSTVEAEISQIFPLAYEDFVQVVLLAQNDFQRFLHANSKTRKELLGKIFGTSRFGKLGEMAKNRRAEAEAAWKELQTKLAAQARALEFDKGETSLSDDAVAALVTAETLSDLVMSARRLANDAAQKRDRAEQQACQTAAKLKEIELVRERQQRRQRAEQTLADREADQERIQHEVSAVLAADTEAKLLMPRLQAAEEKRTEREQAEEDLINVRTRLQQDCALETGARFGLSVGEETTAEEFVVMEEELRELLGQLRSAGDIDAQASAATTMLAQAEENRSRLAIKLAGEQQKYTALPGQLEERRAQLQQATNEAQRCGEYERRVGVEKRKLQAAQSAEQLEQQVQSAEAVARVAERAVDQARATEDEVFTRRLQGSAALLAKELVDDEPCPVCGSLAHPAPTTSDVDLVSDAEVDAAVTQRQEAVDQAKRAEDALKKLQQELHEQQLAAGGVGVTQATELLAEAEQELQRAKKAAVLEGELNAQVAQLSETLTASKQRVADLGSELSQADTAEAIARTEANNLNEQYQKLRAEFETVGDRLAAGERIVRLVRELVEKYGDVTTARNEEKKAADKAAEAIAQSCFGDAHAVRAAELSESQRAVLAAELKTHNEDLASARRILEEPELQQLPEKLVDIVPQQEAEKQAQEELQQANEELGARQEQLKRTEKTVAQTQQYLRDAGPARDRAEVRKKIHEALTGAKGEKLTLEAFVLGEYLDDILDAANQRLGDITANRYTLWRSEGKSSGNAQSGLDMMVSDVYNGRDRSPESLSGGETFLVSLSLALGLADAVTAQAGGLELDTIFIDEGFGSLDAETLDIAMRTLDSLRDSGRTVGVISHVASMHERIPTQIEVSVRSDHSSELQLRDGFSLALGEADR